MNFNILIFIVIMFVFSSVVFISTPNTEKTLTNYKFVVYSMFSNFLFNVFICFVLSKIFYLIYCEFNNTCNFTDDSVYLKVIWVSLTFLITIFETWLDYKDYDYGMNLSSLIDDMIKYSLPIYSLLFGFVFGTHLYYYLFKADISNCLTMSWILSIVFIISFYLLNRGAIKGLYKNIK